MVSAAAAWGLHGIFSSSMMTSWYLQQLASAAEKAMEPYEYMFEIEKEIENLNIKDEP